MARTRQIVYVDTMVVIEATRTGCWTSLLNRFDVRTVSTVHLETQQGNRRIKSYVEVDAALFCEKVRVENVSAEDVLRAQARTTAMAGLDAGERDLLALVARQSPSAWLVTTADRAAVRAACGLGFSERLKALEALATECGLKPDLNQWFTKHWLRAVISQCLLDSL